ncbi:MAG: hypothetical protein ACI30O_06275 [Muribaculaceae bacterium]
MFLLVVFVNMAAGATLFYHSHLDADGQRTVHSHPFIPGSHHTHTGDACEALQLVAGSIQTMIVARTVHVDCNPVFIRIIAAVRPVLNMSRTVTVRIGRAPPYMAA